MICEEITLNKEGTAKLYTYILDKEISYGVDRKWPVFIICPGGGYLLTATKEGEAVATQLLSHGYSCFVLRYSTYLKDRESLNSNNPKTNPHAYYPTQVLELMEAMHIIKENAERWSLDVNHIFTIGFSAGSHISGTMALRYNDPTLINQLSFQPKDNELKPAGSILSYPMLHGHLSEYMNSHKYSKGNILSQLPLIQEALYKTQCPSQKQIQELELIDYINCDTPPMFLWQTNEDVVVNPQDVTKFVLKLQEKHVPCEYHLFSDGPHGLACANRHYAKNEDEINDKVALWLPLALNWVEIIMEGKL